MMLSPGLNEHQFFTGFSPWQGCFKIDKIQEGVVLTIQKIQEVSG